jgi:hypothetical protein
MHYSRVKAFEGCYHNLPLFELQICSHRIATIQTWGAVNDLFGLDS